ncbi:MAG: DNA repair protein RadA [Pseudomonadota bacterium]
MARAQNRFVCQACGSVHSKWAGRCDACGEWNTIAEEVTDGPAHAGSLAAKAGSGRVLSLESLAGASDPPPRLATGLQEFDRVCGGGLVPGTAFLIGGDPGIGKSTLLLQLSARLSATGDRVAYISGEEAIDQIRLRARRLGLDQAPVALAAATTVRDILATLDGSDPPARHLIIDSIQTMWSDALEAAPGTVSQVRACAQELIAFCKRRSMTLFLVGHVTKEGQLAGPRVLEHMVDTVLHFEGERTHHFRILRTVKNRFGPTDEIGVFEMTEAGLTEVANPSEMFLGERSGAVPGAAIFAGMEGSRPVVVEIQALVAPTPFGTPRRSVIGWDTSRLAMILAVLDTRCALTLGGSDIYLNVAGGLKISEPAADLAVAAALVSSHQGIALPRQAVVFGEISLSGEVRAVVHAAQRLKEAKKLGFTEAWTPPLKRGDRAQHKNTPDPSLTVETVDVIQALVEHISQLPPPR